MFKKSKAGVYAQRRYREGLRSWRKRNRWLFAGVCGPFVVAGVAIGIAEHHMMAWMAGLTTGGFLALWITFREMAPSHVETWNQGAEGERRTEKTLRPLERKGWQFFHDIQRRASNYDHIAAGRAGVYLLETKNLRGIIEIRNGVPCRSSRHSVTRQEPLDRIPRQAKAAAANLKEEIESRTGACPWVKAVVVFWGEFSEGLIEHNNCVFIHGSRLRAWMESQPNRLTQANADKIADGIRAIAAEEPAAEHPQSPLDLARV